MFWTKKQKRAHAKIRLGIRLRKNRSILRFLTLGTPSTYGGNIDKAFQVLKKRIKILTPQRLIDDGYISHKTAKYYYHTKYDYNNTLTFNYVRIRTAEGPNGVIHSPYFGDYLPQKWLYDNWKDILQVSNLANQSVDIRACKENVHDTARLSSYVVNHYCTNQDGFLSSSMSWDWCFRGCVTAFYRFKQEKKEQFPNIEMNDILELWDHRAEWVVINRNQKRLDVKLEFPRQAGIPISQDEQDNIGFNLAFSTSDMQKDHEFEKANLPSYYANCYLTYDIQKFYERVFS